jgi:hypothetical protein
MVPWNLEQRVLDLFRINIYMVDNLLIDVEIYAYQNDQVLEIVGLILLVGRRGGRMNLKWLRLEWSEWTGLYNRRAEFEFERR